MKTSTRKVIVRSLCVLIVLASSGVGGGTVDTEVSVGSDGENMTENETKNFNVIVENATNDIGAYRFNITLSNSTTAEIVTVSPSIEPKQSTFKKVIAADGSEALAASLYLSTDRVFESNSPTILTVGVRGKYIGESTLAIDIGEKSNPITGIADRSGNKYNITDNDSVDITVEETPSNLNDIATQYDKNGDNQISVTELGDAARDYAQGVITVSELGSVSREYAKS